MLSREFTLLCRLQMMRTSRISMAVAAGLRGETQAGRQWGLTKRTNSECSKDGWKVKDDLGQEMEKTVKEMEDLTTEVAQDLRLNGMAKVHSRTT